MSIVAVDLGGTQIRTALFDRQGKIIHRQRRDTLAAEGLQPVLERIKTSIREVASEQGTEAITIGCPGPLNPWEGIVYRPPNLPGWRDVPLALLMQQDFGVPVYLENDANLAAMGEHRFGAGRGFSDLVYMTISTGIGGGIISGGKLLRGAKGMAGEVGHMVLDADESAPMCGCGNRGCLEALANGPAIARQARERIAAGEKSAMLGLVNGDPQRITARIVAQAAEAGDPLARELMEGVGYYIGLGISILINVLNPQAIILGGGVSQSLPLFQKPLEAAVEAHALPSARNGVRLLPAALGDDSGLFGGLALALDGGPGQSPS